MQSDTKIKQVEHTLLFGVLNTSIYLIDLALCLLWKRLQCSARMAFLRRCKLLEYRFHIVRSILLATD